MFHLLWYLIIGFIAGLIAKSVMHTRLDLLWTIGLGIAGSIVAGSISHLLVRPREGARFHPAGLVLSIVGAVLVLFIWQKLN